MTPDLPPPTFHYEGAAIVTIFSNSAPGGGASSGLQRYGNGYCFPDFQPSADANPMGVDAVSLHGSDDASQVTGDYAVSGGQGNGATGAYSVALGNGHNASGDYSVALGFTNSATGTASVSTGYWNTAHDYGEHAVGHFGTASAGDSTTIDPGNRIFNVGNGTADGARSDAFSVFADGTAKSQGGITAPRIQVTVGAGGYTATIEDSGKTFIMNGSSGQLDLPSTAGFECRVINTGTAGVAATSGGINEVTGAFGATAIETTGGTLILEGDGSNLIVIAYTGTWTNI